MEPQDAACWQLWRHWVQQQLHAARWVQQESHYCVCAAPNGPDWQVRWHYLGQRCCRKVRPSKQAPGYSLLAALAALGAAYVARRQMDGQGVLLPNLHDIRLAAWVALLQDNLTASGQAQQGRHGFTAIGGGLHALHEVHSSHGFRGTAAAQAGPPLLCSLLLWLRSVCGTVTASHAAGHAACHQVKCIRVDRGCRAGCSG